MADFPVFFTSLLDTVAAFLWQPATQWITACLVLLCIIAVVRRLIRL